MQTEEILRREAEYRAVREALGPYDLTLVLDPITPQPAAELHEPNGAPASAPGLRLTHVPGLPESGR